MPGEGYLEDLIALCQEQGALCIFDEVITGFRIALGGAREYFDLAPDISVYAKAMAGGFSISAAGGRAEIFETLVDGRTSHFGTYNGNPISVAAAIATMDILSEPGTYDRMHQHGYAIRETIEKAAAEKGIPLTTTGTGTAFHVHFGLVAPPNNWREAMEADQSRDRNFRSHLLEQGLYNLPGGRWYVGAAHDDKALEKTIFSIRTAMNAL